MKLHDSQLPDVVRGSHSRTVEAVAVTSFQTATPSFTSPVNGVALSVLGGSVEQDGRAAIRSSLDLAAIEVVFDSDASTVVHPWGAEIFVRHVWPGLGMEARHGFFRIQTVEQAEGPSGAVLITASDRMAGIVDARLPRPRQYRRTATYGAVINTLVHEVYPAAQIVWDNGEGATIGRDLVAERERFEFIDRLIASLGKRWWWDGNGRLQIADRPGVIVGTVDAGADGVMVRFGRATTRDGSFNAVICEGEAGDDQTPVRGTATLTDPDHPLRWGGPFGKVPRFFSSPILTTAAQCRKAARTILADHIGMSYRLDLESVPQPWLEPDDMITVRFPDSMDRRRRCEIPPNTTEVHVIDKTSIPLNVEGVQTIETRDRADAKIDDQEDI